MPRVCSQIYWDIQHFGSVFLLIVIKYLTLTYCSVCMERIVPKSVTFLHCNYVMRRLHESERYLVCYISAILFGCNCGFGHYALKFVPIDLLFLIK